MDKNMIHIDELFSQRLSGAEEGERAGSWARMRELLDEEMPQGAPVSSSVWRRLLNYSAGFLLITSISLGSYKILSSGHSSNTDDASIANNETSTAANKDISTLVGHAHLANVLPRGATFVIRDNKAVILYDPSLTSKKEVMAQIVTRSYMAAHPQKTTVKTHVAISANTEAAMAIRSIVVDHTTTVAYLKNSNGTIASVNDGQMMIATTAKINGSKANNSATGGNKPGTPSSKHAVVAAHIAVNGKHTIASKHLLAATRMHSKGVRRLATSGTVQHIPARHPDSNSNDYNNNNAITDNAITAVAPIAANEDNNASTPGGSNSLYDVQQEPIGKLEVRER